MKDSDHKYLLALNAHERIGGQTLKKVLTEFSNLERLWQKSPVEIERKLGQKITNLIVGAREKFDPEVELTKLEKYNIGYVILGDKDYPKYLAEIPDAPIVLYIRGNVKAIKEIGIAVVGSRAHTDYGRRIARKLVKDCVGAGLSIISGLALGIDGEAHRVALENNGVTVGVLGCGLDRIYPAAHADLAKRILIQNGAIISEYSPGTPSLKQNFPARNRIIAGLSLGTLVIEAGESSGTLITAECALEYNREVFAVPGPIDSPYSFGTNQLIKKGAKLVQSIDDILEELPVKRKKAENMAREILPESEEERAIFDILGAGEQLVDFIIEKSGLNVIAVNSVLTMMEMKGMIENIGGGRYRKTC